MQHVLQIAIVISNSDQARECVELCEAQGWQVTRFSVQDLADAQTQFDFVLFDHLPGLPAVATYLMTYHRCHAVYLGVTRKDIGLPERCSALLETQVGTTLVQHITTLTNVAHFEAQFFRSATAEPITQLPRHDEVLNSMQNHRGQPCGLIVTEIDHAEHLYENLDPVSKTDLLGAIGAHMSNALPREAYAGIFNAACFVAWCPGVTGLPLQTATQKLVDACQRTLSFRSGELNFTVSCGFADTQMLTTPEPLWQAAWAAKETAKTHGGNCSVAAFATEHLSARIPEALTRNEFSLALQPQWDIRGAELTGAEVLLRWQGLDVGKITPDQFIPLAERHGEINRVGDWVLAQTCANIAAWSAPPQENLLVGINVSPQQFNKGSIAHLLEALIKQQQLNPCQLELELSHENLLSVVDQHRRTLFQLRDLGVRIAIDNLGVGIVDTQKLLRCPADTLKIDRTLLASMQTDPSVRTLVAQICQVGERFDLRTVAVGIENESQRNLMENLGCTDGQGYLFSPPIPMVDFARYVSTRNAQKKSPSEVAR